MRAPLAELLESLAGTFAGPAPLPRAAFRAARKAGWAGSRLQGALDRLLQAPGLDLTEAYADAFLVNCWHPVLHLEASAHRAGHLCDEAVLGRREAFHAALGFRPSPKRSPDHLATDLEALAFGLRRLAERGGSPDLEASLRGFLEADLLPDLRVLQALAQDRPLSPAYAAALEVVEALALELLEGMAPVPGE